MHLHRIRAALAAPLLLCVFAAPATADDESDRAPSGSSAAIAPAPIAGRWHGIRDRDGRLAERVALRIGHGVPSRARGRAVYPSLVDGAVLCRTDLVRGRRGPGGVVLRERPTRGDGVTCGPGAVRAHLTPTGHLRPHWVRTNLDAVLRRC